MNTTVARHIKSMQKIGVDMKMDKEQRQKLYAQGFTAGVAAMLKEFETEIKAIKAERDGYRDELIYTLRRAMVCKGQAEGEKVCHECPYFCLLDLMDCPNMLTYEYAEKRLKELCDNDK